ncbi:MAG: alanine racemase [Herbinix sp.]|nr:alanine racemase [Herbinix sp.]
MKRVTIKDVAREAGVSITTVSHVLNNAGNIGADTRERVIEIAKSMHYAPDFNGSKLKMKNTHIIGLFVPMINGYYGDLANAIHQACLEAGYELDIFIAAEKELLIRNLLRNRVDGAILPFGNLEEADEEILINSGVPLIFLDRERCSSSVSSVVFDSYAAGKEVGEYLIKLGHKNFLFVKGYQNYDCTERRRGFEDALSAARAELSEDNIIDGNCNRQSAYHSMKAYLGGKKPLPDAVFAVNDDCAIGCIEALTEDGYQVPKDISVVGCDNILLSQWFVPSITTYDTDVKAQGSAAVDQLLRMIEGETMQPGKKITGKLIERQSTINKF